MKTLDSRVLSFKSSTVSNRLISDLHSFGDKNYSNNFEVPGIWLFFLGIQQCPFDSWDRENELIRCQKSQSSSLHSKNAVQ